MRRSPIAAAEALRLRSAVRRGEQLARNAEDARGWLDATGAAIRRQVAIVDRARDLVVRALGGRIEGARRAPVAGEIDRLRATGLAVANTTYLGRPVFAGTAAGTEAYDTVTGAYRGDDAPVDRSVAADVAVRINVTGTEAFGPVGSDLFALLACIADDLRGDLGVLPTHLDALDTCKGRLTAQLGAVRERVDQVGVLRRRVAGEVLAATIGLVDVEVDLDDQPAPAVALQLREMAYEAALCVTSGASRPSLLEFLR